MSAVVRVIGAWCLLVAGIGVNAAITSVPAVAASGQAGAPQVVLNPGGGILPDGSDGIRFTVNAAEDYVANVTTLGQDAVHYRGARQYCCVAGGPMLNVGGTLFGQAGPASASASWTSITVLSASGSTAVGARTDVTGPAEARLRYVATKGGREYVMERTVSYAYPNDFVTDSYLFTIPAGNTEPVKFYLGGDTAPGGSDIGFGVMLGEPVRTVISLNPDSGVQFGFAELGDSKPFDGATSQHYNAPYDAVRAGGDIGFVGTPSEHDAGLMMQWDLGSTPGSQRAALRQFVTPQGTQLIGSFDKAYAGPEETVNLNLVIQNTEFTAVSGLGFTMALPAGTTRATAPLTTTCGGSLEETGTSVTLTGGTVAGTDSCLVRVPVQADEIGVYSISTDNATGLSQLANNIGSTSFAVLAPPQIDTGTELGELTVGEPFTAALTAQSEQPPTWSISAGELPAGLTLDEVTGQVSGTPQRAGDYDFTVSASNAGGTDTRRFTGTIARGATAVTGTLPSAPVAYGDEATLTAAGLPASATGTVTFTSGDVTLCTVTLPQTSCTAEVDLLPGSHPVTADYSGDSDWLPDSASIGALSVVAATATVEGSLSATSTSFGTPVTVNAEVTPSGATGSVTVTAGAETLCTITLPETACSGGAELEPGTHPIALSYSGDPRHLTATASAGVLEVTRATPAPDPIDPVRTVFGGEVELSLPELPELATGVVSFSAGGDVLCSYELPDETSCTASHGLGAGTHELQIDYLGDARFEPVQRIVTLAIDWLSTEISSPETLSSSYGTAATITVAGLPADAEGRVSVRLGLDELCGFDVDAATECELPADLPAGAHGLLVLYSGDDNHLGSNSITLLTVDRAGTAIEVRGPRRVEHGDQPVFVVTGLPADATGTVTVTAPGLGVICSFEVTETDRCADAVVPPGSWTLTAAYSGDGNFAGSRTEVELVVEREEIVLAPSDPAVQGSYGSGIQVGVGNLPADATGTVVVSHLVDGQQVVLCTITLPGERSCTIDSLGAGTYQLSLSYSGDDQYAASVVEVTASVAKAPLDIDLSAAGLQWTEGEVAAIEVTGLPEDATGPVTLSVTGPAAARAAASPARISARAASLAPVPERRAASERVLCTFDAGAASGCTPETPLEAGTYQLSADYTGDANYLGARATASLVVAPGDGGPAPTATVLPETGSSLGVLVAGPAALLCLVVGGALVWRRRRPS